MEINESVLREIIAGRPFGTAWPYLGGTINDIEQFLNETVHQLADSRLIKVKAEINHYGSGYASYIDVFCWKKDGSSTIQKEDLQIKKGLSIYLCRLAPFAVIGCNETTETRQGGSSYGFLNEELMESQLNSWSEETREIGHKLEVRNFILLSKHQVTQSLDFEAEIPTILASPPYRVFDALFYWED